MKGFVLETDDGILFSIVPKDSGDWKIVKRNTIIVTKDAQPGETQERFERRMKSICRGIEVYRKRSAKP